MNRFLKLTRAALWLTALVALSSCGPAQAASPTPEPVDVKAVMTSAASTAFVELTAIANQATATPRPTTIPTLEPATETPDPAQAVSTTDPALEATATLEVAAGLPATETPAVMAGTPAPAVVPPVAPANTGPTCLNAQFVLDVTIPDGTVLKTYEKFRKIWRIQNTGTCAWDQGFGFVFAYGDSDMGGYPQYFSKIDQPVGPGGVIDLGVEMRAPTKPGDYYGHWSMISDSGKLFGQAVMVYIKVVK